MKKMRKPIPMYTPGPWHKFPRLNEGGQHDGCLHVGPAEHSVAAILHIDDEHANGDLVAAAPCLLEACQALVASVEHGTEGDNSAVVAMQMAHAAIAKAARTEE